VVRPAPPCEDIAAEPCAIASIDGSEEPCIPAGARQAQRVLLNQWLLAKTPPALHSYYVITFAAALGIEACLPADDCRSPAGSSL
jgi:hypothetical protein